MSEKPNILLISTDQQRRDTLGCYGAHWLRTPHLDRLASEGAAFDNCYVNNTICTPSRASMWTGKHLPGHGVYKLYDTMPKDEVLFSEYLQHAGYATGLFGKLHVSGRMFEADNRLPHDGFDEYEWSLEASIHLDSRYNGYAKWLQNHHPDFYAGLKEKGRELLHHPKEVHFTHWAAERSIDFIKRHAGHRPFFCCMSVFDPHNPYQDYPEEMRTMVDEHALPEPLPDERTEVPDGVRRERDHSYLGRCAACTRDAIRSMRLGYFASIAFIDEEVGRVLSALEEAGTAENTLVIFVSDHGDMLGDHGLLVKGAFFYDESAKVPLIMRWPERIPAGRRCNALVQPHDLAATVLDAAGAEQSEFEQGGFHDAQSLIPLASGATEEVREYAVCAYRNSGISDAKRPWDPPIHSTMIRDERYKLSVYHTDQEGRGELYDMKRDPDELHNLHDVPQYAEVKHRLLQALIEWMFQNEVGYLGSRGGEVLPGEHDRLDNMMKGKGGTPWQANNTR
jgi:choline-sulfatase